MCASFGKDEWKRGEKLVIRFGDVAAWEKVGVDAAREWPLGISSSIRASATCVLLLWRHVHRLFLSTNDAPNFHFN